jgi:hypothetical protein
MIQIITLESQSEFHPAQESSNLVFVLCFSSAGTRNLASMLARLHSGLERVIESIPMGIL